MIYLDNAATTRLSERAKQAMEPYLKDLYGNPSAIYEFGETSKKAVRESREIIAGALHCAPENIFFTSGGTESDNWVLEHAMKQGKYITTSQIEHHAILNKCRQLQGQGANVTYIGTDREGTINLPQLENNIVEGNTLISVMTANNEVGTIEPVSEIGRIAHRHHALFHTDAVQAFGHIPINVNRMNIDFLSASAHKFHGPKGVGFLYVREPEKFAPMIYGGEQERGYRSGTENVAGIVGMGEAAKEAMEQMDNRMRKEQKLRNYLAERLMREIPYTRINGSTRHRLPGNLNLSFAGVEGAALVVLMDENQICISAGSACSASDTNPSHVLKALGQSDEEAYEAVRISLNFENTRDEIDFTIRKFQEIVIQMRKEK